MACLTSSGEAMERASRRVGASGGRGMSGPGSAGLEYSPVKKVWTSSRMSAVRAMRGVDLAAGRWARLKTRIASAGVQEAKWRGAVLSGSVCWMVEGS